MRTSMLVPHSFVTALLGCALLLPGSAAASSFTINDLTQAEGNSGTTAFTFSVTQTRANPSAAATVDVATANGTATTGDNDYAAVATTLNFPASGAGSSFLTVRVNVTGDAKYETNETFTVNLSNPVNATIADNQGVGIITNDDAVPAFTINDVTQAEGNSGTTMFTFTVTKTGATMFIATVDVATTDGTATAADNDYAALLTTTLTFAPGEMTRLVTVNVTGDMKYEGNETFTVNLSNPANATITGNQGVGTITNDDAAPAFTINDVTQAEGNAGTTVFTFTVTKTGATALTATVDVATADGTATIADNDYTAVPTTTLTFLPVETTKSVSVNVTGDVKFETNETFTVNLSNPVNATIAGNQGVGTIQNDDGLPALGYAKGDFTNDGKSDILWRNMATGENLLWTMDGFTQVGSSSYPTVTDLNWKVQAVGDYNADSKSDLVWRNSVTGQNVTWFMDGSTMLSFGYPPDIADTNWTIQASGDLNRDGQFDLLWRNAANGLNVWWYMSGANLVQWGFLPDIADLNWKMYGSGDLDADTKWDLVWRNGSSGLNVVWMLNGNAFDRWAFMPDITDLNWKIQAVADYNRDGKADLIWRNMATGQNVYWIMSGPNLVSYGFLPTVSDLNWQIVGPR